MKAFVLTVTLLVAIGVAMLCPGEVSWIQSNANHTAYIAACGDGGNPR